MAGARSGRKRIFSLVLVLAVALPACGGGDSASTAPAPEDRRASAAEVAAGLARIDGLVQQVAGLLETDTAKAGQVHEQIRPQWQLIEGTIKANDRDAYLTFEDSLAALGSAVRDGDAAGASKDAADVSAAVTRYLAAYPG